MRMTETTKFDSKIFGNLESDLFLAYQALTTAEHHARRLKMTETADRLLRYKEDVMRIGYGLYDQEVWDRYVTEFYPRDDHE